MPYFYIKPVQGNTSLHILEECVLQRWKYFQLHTSIPDEFCQYIIEGSAYDNIGHFMLNYLALISNNPNFLSTVLNCEENLFFNRIANTTSNGLRLLSQYILKRVHIIKQNNVSLSTVLEPLCTKMLLKHVAQHLSHEQHSDQCSVYKIGVNFSLCLPLIAKRQVEVKYGVASIPCGKWKTLFKILFRNHLENRNSKPNNLITNLDPRWRELILRLTHMINFSKPASKILKYTDIDEKSSFFPLCMKNLHTFLRKNHRLSHNARFRYSLFLKDIGLPVQQAMRFWQEEYSKPCQHQSICNHNWERDSGKYIYGIRHLYGLEGSRKNYCMVNCKAIQYNAQAENGCPFKHFDTDNLKRLIDFNIINDDEWENILQNVRSKQYSSACRIYKIALLNSLQCVSSDASFNPLSYFNDLNSASEFTYI